MVAPNVTPADAEAKAVELDTVDESAEVETLSLIHIWHEHKALQLEIDAEHRHRSGGELQDVYKRQSHFCGSP